jgi:16S rRNA G527 N7-methylase RsmG
VEGCRYEDLLAAARADLHEAADVITVRAVRVSGTVLGNLQRLVRVGGSVFLFRGPTEGDVPDDLRPPLGWAGTYPLVESLGSRLVVLAKS